MFLHKLSAVSAAEQSIVLNILCHHLNCDRNRRRQRVKFGHGLDNCFNFFLHIYSNTKVSLHTNNFYFLKILKWAKEKRGKEQKLCLTHWMAQSWVDNIVSTILKSFYSFNGNIYNFKLYSQHGKQCGVVHPDIYHGMVLIQAFKEAKTSLQAPHIKILLIQPNSAIIILFVIFSLWLGLEIVR